MYMVWSVAGQTVDDSAYLQEIQSVVRIYVTRGRERSIGAGTFVNATGDIVTAYHVIQKADKIEVIGSKGKYGDPEIVKFDEERDLALIKVSRKSDDNAYIPVGTIPAGIESRDSHAYGHPDGKLNFRISVNVNRSGTMQSGEYLGPGGAPVFAKKNITILPIDGTLDAGMSGGPLISGGKLIGVISGTLAPSGRALGWAIPADSIYEAKPAHGKSITQLPPLALLARGFSSPNLKSGEITERFRKLDDFHREIAAWQRKIAAVEDDKQLENCIRQTRANIAKGFDSESIDLVIKINQVGINRHNEMVSFVDTMFESLVQSIGKDSDAEIESLTEEHLATVLGWRSAPLLRERELSQSLGRKQERHKKLSSETRTFSNELKERLGASLKSDGRKGAGGVVIEYAVAIEELDSLNRDILNTMMELAEVNLGILEKLIMLKAKNR